MEMTDDTEQSVPLFWSRRGAVACAPHAPATTLPEWSADGWKPVPDFYRDRRGVALQCQWCYGTPLAGRPSRGGPRAWDSRPVSREPEHVYENPPAR